MTNLLNQGTLPTTMSPKLNASCIPIVQSTSEMPTLLATFKTASYSKHYTSPDQTATSQDRSTYPEFPPSSDKPTSTVPGEQGYLSQDSLQGKSDKYIPGQRLDYFRNLRGTTSNEGSTVDPLFGKVNATQFLASMKAYPDQEINHGRGNNPSVLSPPGRANAFQAHQGRIYYLNQLKLVVATMNIKRNK